MDLANCNIIDALYIYIIAYHNTASILFRSDLPSGINFNFLFDSPKPLANPDEVRFTPWVYLYETSAHSSKELNSCKQCFCGSFLFKFLSLPTVQFSSIYFTS